MPGPLLYLGLGSNLGDRRAFLQAARAGLSAVPGLTVLRAGPVVETAALLAPGAREPQPPFLNTALQVASRLGPGEVLAACLGVEASLGRVRQQRWGARTIDVDVLLLGGLALDAPGLTVPHPELHRRRFVLEPLAALDARAVHPRLGRTVGQLLEGLPVTLAPP